MLLFPAVDRFLNLYVEITDILGPVGVTKTKAYAIKGVAEYISMRAMKNTNILLDTDYGIKKVFEKHPELLNKELQEKWNPWKTYITIGLWNYLEKME